MASVRTPLSTGTAESNIIVREVWRGLSRLEPDTTPLLTLTSIAEDQVRTVKAMTFRHWEQADFKRSIQINNAGGYASNITSIVVDDASGVYPNATILVPRTQEILQATAISGNTLTVTRNVGGGGASAVNQNETMVILGTAAAEGGTMAASDMLVYGEKSNNCQIFENDFNTSDVMNMTETYVGDMYQERRRDAFAQHKKDIELSLLWGQAAVLNSATANPIYLTRGVYNYITTNVTDVGGLVTEQQFEQNVLEPAFRYGGDTKILLAPRRFVSVIDSWGREKLRVNQEMTEEYGMEIKEYISSHGRLLVKRHKLLEIDHAGTPVSTPHLPSRVAFILDPSNIRLAVMRGGRTQLLENLQNPNQRFKQGAYLSYLGLDLMQEQTHALIRNIQG